MGYTLNHGIAVVDHGYGNAIDRAHAQAVEIFGSAAVSGLLGPMVNGVRSFFVAPDGSKEGWHDSNEGDTRRDDFVAHLREYEYNDRSSPLDWAELCWGGDWEAAAYVVRDSLRAAQEGEK